MRRFVAALVFVCSCAHRTDTVDAGQTTGSFPADEFKSVTVQDVAGTLKAHGDVVIYDCNSRETYEAGHVPEAKWVAFDAVSRSDLPTDPRKQLIFYCGGEKCSASHTAARKALALGFREVSVMRPGIRGWIAAGMDTEKGPGK